MATVATKGGAKSGLSANLPDEVRSASLPSRDHIFEFELAPSERADGKQAIDIELISKL